ncbi:MAG: RraA family protein [Chloroflexi bacterium]|nr:RraA family protein [Chloroflexota bacterium]
MADRLLLHPRPTPIPPEWIAIYRQVTTSALGHVVDDGFVDPAIRPLLRGVQVAGTAITVRLPDRDLEPLVPVVDSLQPGDVLVIDHGGITSRACWGALTSLAARTRGAVAVVVDGAVADLRAIEGHGLPTFARGVSALGDRRLGRGGGVNVPIQCGGVAVHPGDLVVADDDGVVVIPPALLDDVATRVEGIVQRTPLARAWIERGGLLGEIADLDPAGVQALLQQHGWL